MDLTGMIEHCRPRLEAVRQRLGEDGGEAIGRLVATGAFHLDAARFGARLYSMVHSPDDYDTVRRLGETPTTLETAAANLVFRGVVTALDLCAAALYRLNAPSPGVPGGRERDMAWWNSPGRRASLTPEQASWVSSIQGSEDWTLLEEARHAYTHRTVPRHVRLQLGSLVGPQGPDPEMAPVLRRGGTEIVISGRKHDLADILPRLVAFGELEWRAFVDLLQ